MLRTAFFFIAIALAFSGYGQKELSFNVGAKHHEKGFIFLHSFENERELPIFQSDLGIRSYTKKDTSFVEIALSWRHTRIQREWEPSWITPDPQLNDPAIPQGKLREEYILNYAGIKIGGGFRFSSPKGRHSLVLPVGLQCHLPFASTYVWESENVGGESNYYSGGAFLNGIYYGAYLRPTYEFNFSGEPDNPWRFSVYTEGDLLIHNKSGKNPKYLIGGGLGVTYRLGTGSSEERG